MEGWVKLHRKLLNWEWKNHHPTYILFIELLLRANHKQTSWRGEIIAPGQLITGRKQLSQWCRLSEQQIRGSIKRLKSTNDIYLKTTNNYSIITITNWIDYQQQQPAREPSTNQQLTTSKNVKNVKKKEDSMLGASVFVNDVINYLNKITQKKFSSKSKSNIKFINARFKEGYSLEDFKRVINTKSEQWINDDKMNTYLRPSTLFNSDKFDSYLNEIKQDTKQSIENQLYDMLIKPAQERLNADKD